MSKSRTIGMAVLSLLAAVAMLGISSYAGPQMHKSSPFQGPKANTGYVTHSKEGQISKLTLSSDFVVPDTPDPHWMLVDSRGVTYIVQKLKVKNDGYNMSIEVPAYVRDVKKVIIWCAWAETNLGEAEFAQAVK